MLDIKSEILSVISIPDRLLEYIISDGNLNFATKENCGLSRRAAIDLLNNESQGLKETNQPWRFFLESLTSYKYCRTCNSYHDRVYYHNNLSSSDLLAAECKSCANSRAIFERNKDVDKARQNSKKHYENNKQYYSEKAIRRKALLLSRIPKWADLDKIKEIYDNRPEGCHVDHEVPLQGRNVCGLHVEYNLQYLSIEDNLRKSNSF